MRSRTLRALFVALASVTVAGALPASAFAASPAGMTAPGLVPVHPGADGYFEYTLSSGQTATAHVVVRNQGDIAARYLLYTAAADTSPVGGISYGQPLSVHPGPAGWMSPAITTLDVPPGTATTAAVRIVVPPGTPAGQYVAAIAAQDVPSASASAASTSPVRSGQPRTAFLVTTRSVVAVVVRVPGPTVAAARVSELRIGVDAHRQVITIPIQDTGTALMKPTLNAELSRCSDGKTVLSATRQLDTFVPKTSIDYPWYPQYPLAQGCYEATVALSYNGVRLAAYRGRLRVSAAAAKVPAQGAPTPITPAATNSSRWEYLAGGGGLLALVCCLLLVRSRIERRRLLARLELAGRGKDAD